MKKLLTISLVVLIFAGFAGAECPKADLNNDCKVDLEDFAIMASEWLTGVNIPDDMVLIPSGVFTYQNGSPVYQNTFAIGKYETTVQQYCDFLNAAVPYGEYNYSSLMEIDRSGVAGSYTYTVQAGRGQYPVRYVNMYDAHAYAAWKSSQTGMNFRLPTEQEWEKAAGWDPDLQKLWTYAFQKDSIDSTWCNYHNDYGGPLPVGSFNGAGDKNNAKSYYGCYDMSGNVWEWTSSIYFDTHRVVRGGNWNSYASDVSVTYRVNGAPPHRYFSVGFRLVLDLN